MHAIILAKSNGATWCLNWNLTTITLWGTWATSVQEANLASLAWILHLQVSQASKSPETILGLQVSFGTHKCPEDSLAGHLTCSLVNSMVVAPMLLLDITGASGDTCFSSRGLGIAWTNAPVIGQRWIRSLPVRPVLRHRCISGATVSAELV